MLGFGLLSDGEVNWHGSDYTGPEGSGPQHSDNMAWHGMNNEGGRGWKLSQPNIERAMEARRFRVDTFA